MYSYDSSHLLYICGVMKPVGLDVNISCLVVFFFQSLNYIDHKQKLVRCTEIEVVLSSQSQLFSVGAQFLALLFFLFCEKDKLDLENQI